MQAVNNVQQPQQFNRGEIWLVNLPFTGNSIQGGGIRPVVLCSNNMANLHSPILHCAPLTTRKKPSLPTHSEIDTDCGIVKKSTVLCEQLMPLPKNIFKARIGFCNEKVMDKLDFCLSVHLGLVKLVRRNNVAYAN